MSVVDHPNIVRVYEYFECDEIVFIVMEFMMGGELFERIIEKEYYTEKQAADSFRPIVDAVRYCHKMGIVHRDLKVSISIFTQPENLLYCDSLNNALIKVSDFGLARFMTSKESLYTACGTPTYIAPEVLVEVGYDSKCDCWSLGVILYVMLCGFPPFYEEDEVQLFSAIKLGHFDFPSPYWDSVSDTAKDLIIKLLCRNPEKRLSAEEILKHPWLVNNFDNQLFFQASEYKKHKALRLVSYYVILEILYYG
jgi:calcium/calmodulin-dependent protein kinase I